MPSGTDTWHNDPITVVKQIDRMFLSHGYGNVTGVRNTPRNLRDAFDELRNLFSFHNFVKLLN